MGDLNPVAVVAALLGVGGAGAFIRDFVDGILKLRNGVSAKETKRKIDIVQQRDEAIARESEALDRAEKEATRARRAMEYASRLRRVLIEAGLAEKIPAWPAGLGSDTGPTPIPKG